MRSLMLVSNIRIQALIVLFKNNLNSYDKNPPQGTEFPYIVEYLAIQGLIIVRPM